MTTTNRKSVTICLNRSRIWRWQVELVERLARHRDVYPVVRLIDGPHVPRTFKLLLELEKLVFRLHGEHACDLLDENILDSCQETPGAGDNGRVLDLTGQDVTGIRSDISVRYDGSVSDDAVLLAVLEGRSPALSIVSGADRVMMSGLSAVEDRTVATRALDNVFSALLQLCEKAATAPMTSGSQSSVPPVPARDMHAGKFLAFGAAALKDKLNTRIAKFCRRAPNWFVAWRQMHDPDATISLPGIAAYQRLADDGGRYYADPFPIVVDGKMHLFVEEYDMSLGKGLISVSMLTSGGFERPKPVLETPYHLSYPHVFEHEGTIWMIPESLQSRTVDLYRATSFPGGWVHEATLLQDIEASDATICRHGGLWWMFAATRSWLGSNWDTLSVFWASELTGPWQPHAGNPILVDHRCARPAGEFFRRDGALWRPVQDCSDGYGSGLAFCRIDALDLQSVRQSVQSTIRLRDGKVQRGPHSVNRAGGIEVIDLYGAPL